jgi:hypothetical protein
VQQKRIITAAGYFDERLYDVISTCDFNRGALLPNRGVLCSIILKVV